MIPVLDWQRVGAQWLAWVNDIEVYTIKPVVYVDAQRTTLQFELRLGNAATGMEELVGIGYSREDVLEKAREHVGDSDPRA